jgi:hypothetical protein
MKQALLQRTILAFSFTVIVLSVPSIASAQSGSFAATYTPFSGRITIADARKAAVGPKMVDFNQMGVILQSAWDKARTEITKKGDDFLRERDVGRGVRTSNNVILLAEKGYPLISTTSSGFSIKFLLPNNTIATTFRTPGPLPAFSDPRVSISCDVVLKIDVFWTDSRMTVTPATMVIGCRDPVGRNITGDLVIGVAGLIKSLGGPDFIGQALASINRNFPLSPQITRDFSKYFDGKVGANTQIEVSDLRDGVDGSGKPARRVVVTIEDKAKEYVIH